MEVTYSFLLVTGRNSAERLNLTKLFNLPVAVSGIRQRSLYTLFCSTILFQPVLLQAPLARCGWQLGCEQTAVSISTSAWSLR